MQSMILFPRNGNLGNQVLQVFGLWRLGLLDSTVFIGFDEYSRLFTKPKIQNLSTSILGVKSARLIDFYLVSNLHSIPYQCLSFLGKKVFSVCSLDHLIQTNLSCSPRWLVVNTFFQDDLSGFHGFLRLLTISPDYLRKALHLVHHLRITPDNLGIIHIRGKDYCNNRTDGISATPPPEFFLKGVRYIENLLGYCLDWVIVTDDLPLCADYGLKYPVISTDPYIDFSLISLASYAVISPSTYSLVAACLNHNLRPVDQLRGHAPLIVAPKFWMGHKSRLWEPPLFRLDFLHYIDSSDLS